MDLADGACFCSKHESQSRSHSRLIPDSAAQPDAETGLAGGVAEEPGGGVVLRHDEIRASVLIEIGNGGATLLAVHLNSRLLAWHDTKLSGAIAEQQQPAPGIQAWHFALGIEEVLAEEHVFMAIPIKVGHDDRERRPKLRFARQFRL